MSQTIFDSKNSFVDDDTTYNAGYNLRRSHSTMTARGLDVLIPALSTQRNTLADGSRFRLLSVGCGDGVADRTLLEALEGPAGIDYVGADPSETALLSCRTRFFEGPGSESLYQVKLLNTDSSSIESGEGPFDAILFSHSLYYFDDPVQSTLDLAERVGGGGIIYVLLSCERGMPKAAADIEGLFRLITAEAFCNDLARRGISFRCTTFESTLDVTEVLQGSTAGERLLEFCLEVPARDLEGPVVSRLRDSLRALSIPIGPRRYLTENFALIEIAYGDQ